MEHYAIPALNRKPDKVIIHAGTNNVKKDSVQDAEKKMVNLANSIKRNHPGVKLLSPESSGELMVNKKTKR